jgi:hypothetical protein
VGASARGLGRGLASSRAKRRRSVIGEVRRPPRRASSGRRPVSGSAIGAFLALPRGARWPTWSSTSPKRLGTAEPRGGRRLRDQRGLHRYHKATRELWQFCCRGAVTLA